MYEELTESLRKCGRLNMGDECICFHDGCCEAEPTCMYELMREAADAIEELSMKLHGDEAAIAGMKRDIERMAVAGKPRWIPMTEAPALKVGDEGYPGYLVYVNGYYDVADYGVDRLGNGPRFLDEYELDITHYMPLPEPPKEDENND